MPSLGSFGSWRRPRSAPSSRWLESGGTCRSPVTLRRYRERDGRPTTSATAAGAGRTLATFRIAQLLD